jgi:hypothetical protein
MSDLLLAASRALRDDAQSRADTSKHTRARIASRLARKQGRRRRLAMVLWPIAATLVLSTAWAAASRASRHSGGAISPGEVASVVAPIALRSAGGVPTEGPPAMPVDESMVASVRAEETHSEGTVRAVPEARPQPARPPTLRSQSRTASPNAAATYAAVELPAAPGGESDRSVAELSLYRHAHALYFVGHDFDAALAAWDAYLRAAPEGTFAREARYNRALCLLRIGRRREGLEALAPFAEEPGGAPYRQSAAKALIDALGH